MRVYRVAKVVGLLALIALVLVITACLYFWNAQYTLMNVERNSSAFRLSLYRFRPIAVFEFRSKTIITDRFSRIVFGATTIARVERVSWLKGNQAVLIDLSSSYDSESTQHETHLYFNFKRNCLLTTLDGSTTETEFARLTANMMTSNP